MEKEKKSYFQRNKKVILPLMIVLSISFVFAAGYVVKNVVINSDVYEAFDGIEYSVIGDGGNWNGVDDCSTATTWMTLEEGQEIDVQGLYPGEGRLVCVRFNNLGEADITYTLSNIIVQGEGNYAECVYAFGENTKTGTALGSSSVLDGVGIIVPSDSPVVNDCKISIDVSRG